MVLALSTEADALHVISNAVQQDVNILGVDLQAYDFATNVWLMLLELNRTGKLSAGHLQQIASESFTQAKVTTVKNTGKVPASLAYIGFSTVKNDDTPLLVVSSSLSNVSHTVDMLTTSVTAELAGDLPTGKVDQHGNQLMERIIHTLTCRLLIIVDGDLETSVRQVYVISPKANAIIAAEVDMANL